MRSLLLLAIFSVLTACKVTTDADGDGYAFGDDCDDDNGEINDGAAEVCNGIDDNCDGSVDGGADDAVTYFVDADGDTFGDGGAEIVACDMPEGVVENAGDCDDANPDAHPGVTEVCNGIDDDCDWLVDPDTSADAYTWFADVDHDSFGDPLAPLRRCEQPPDSADDNSDCDDWNKKINPDAIEICNGADDDCDGVTDPVTSSDAKTWFADVDEDGYGDPDVSTEDCVQPIGYVDSRSDCAPGDADTYPGAREICDDGFENNCSSDGLYDCDATECTGELNCWPTIDAITPNTGSEHQITAVTIIGSGFGTVTAGTPVVTFGAEGDCTDVVVIDDETLTCDTPAGNEGVVDVIVTTGNGDDTLEDGFEYKPGSIYAADGKSATSGSLYSIDVATGTVTTIGKIGYAVTGMAFAPDGTLYAITANNGSDAYLITIDLSTGLGTAVAPISGPSYESMPDCTFVGSRLISWSESGDTPYEVDITTGAATLLGSTYSVGSAGSGLAYDGSTLWFVPYGNASIYTINPTTGTGTSTGVTMYNLIGDTFNSMTFHAGTMYVNDADRGGGSSVLSSVDTATGKITAVATMSAYIDAIASPSP